MSIPSRGHGIKTIRAKRPSTANGLKADGARNRAEWARMMAVEMKKHGLTRINGMVEVNGECVDSTMPGCYKEPLAIPDLAAVEASLDRSRLLLQSGTDIAAMALDAANSIQATNSLEKMLAHQMAAMHKQAMEQMDQVPTSATPRLRSNGLMQPLDAWPSISKDYSRRTMSGKTASSASSCNMSM